MSNDKRNNTMDGVMAEVKKMMGATAKELKSMQDHPIGVNPRTRKEKKAFFDRIMRLPKERRNQLLDDQLRMSGHKGNEPDDCETCKFLEEGFSDR